MKTYCVLGTKIVPLKQARLALNDLGVLRGYGVFDFLRTFNGKPFLFDEHFARFERSAKLIGLSVPVSKATVSRIIRQLMKKNHVKDASLRLVVTGGPTPDGMTRTKPVFYILCEDLYTLPDSVFTKGAKLITQEYMRPFPSGKTTHYLMAMTLQEKKRKGGALEILYVSGGQVYEASTSNIFIVSKGVLITPKSSVLPGITRMLAIRLAREQKIKVVERPVSVKELFTVDEVFLTATNKDIAPIVSIDGKKVGGGVVGPITKKLLAAYRAYTRSF